MVRSEQTYIYYSYCFVDTADGGKAIILSDYFVYASYAVSTGPLGMVQIFSTKHVQWSLRICPCISCHFHHAFRAIFIR